MTLVAFLPAYGLGRWILVLTLSTKLHMRMAEIMGRRVMDLIIVQMRES